MDNEIIEAVREHAEKIEAKAAADRLEIKALKDANAEQSERLSGFEQEFATLKAARGHGGDNGPDIGPSPVRSFIESDGLKSFLNGQNSTGRIELKNSSLKILCKSVVNAGRGGSGDQNYSVQNDRDTSNLWGYAQRPLTLLEALPVIKVGTSSFEFTQLDPSYSNAADYQTEGAEKAEGGFPTVDAVANIATIAHWIPVSNQVLADAPSLAVQIENLLRVGVFQRAEGQILTGIGGTGKIKGIIPQATAFVATSDDPQDRIGEAVTALAAAGWNGQPAIIMNPADWGAISRTRGTSEGTYLLGSPVAPAPPVLWNTPVIQSASVPAGTVVVADLSQLALLDREQVTVQASREARFTSNVTILLGEGRMGLAIFSPSAVLSVDLTP